MLEALLYPAFPIFFLTHLSAVTPVDTFLSMKDMLGLNAGEQYDKVGRVPSSSRSLALTHR